MHRPIEARQHGIEIVHQDLALCDNLTAAANVFLGREIAEAASARFAFSTMRRCIAAPARSSPN